MRLGLTIFGIIVATLCSSSFALPVVTGINPSGNILTCEAAQSALESYSEAKAAFLKLKAKYSNLQDGTSAYKSAQEILKMAQGMVDDAAKDYRTMYDAPMAWVSVEMDHARDIPLSRVHDAELSIDKVHITPSTLKGDTVSVSAQEIQLTLFAEAICKNLKAENGDVNSAVEKSVNSLFAP